MITKILLGACILLVGLLFYGAHQIKKSGGIIYQEQDEDFEEPNELQNHEDRV